MQSSTSVQEIEKVTLRFMRVVEDVKLSQVLQKILPELVKIHFESDLSNSDANHPKAKSLNELMGHLSSRVLNSRGVVQVPVGPLLQIFNDDCYKLAQNQLLKRQATELIYLFVTAALDYSIDKIDGVDFLKQTIDSLQGTIPILEKVRLFIMCLHYLIKVGKTQQIEEMFNGSPNLKPVFLQFVVFFTIALISCPYNRWQSALKPIFLGQMQAYRRSDSKLSEVQHNQLFENLLLTQLLQNQALFSKQEVLTIMILATTDQQSCSHGVRESCLLYLKGFQLDLEDISLEDRLYKLLNHKYDGIYAECVQNFDQMGLIGPPTDTVLKYLIGWVMKLETKTDISRKMQIVRLCLFDPVSSVLPGMHKCGLLYIRSIIRGDPLLSDFGIVLLKNALVQVVNVSNYQEEEQALAMLMIAELAAKNFKLVLGGSIEYALQTFERLKVRIEEISDKKQSVREDDISLTLMEALNKLRDCFEQNVTDLEQKETLLAKIVSFLHSSEARDQKNSELLYILYLYVARLDKDNLKADLLLHSVNLRDHIDIKIRKEAIQQIERFEKASQAQTAGMLAPFLDAIKHLFRSEQNPLLSLFVDNDSSLKQSLSYNSNQGQYLNAAFIDKITDLTAYAIKFYQQDKNCHEDLEKLLMLNLNQNFTQLKSDFQRALKLIKTYLKQTDGVGGGVLVSPEGAVFINKIGAGTSLLDQRILSLKLLFTIFSRKPQLYQQTEVILNQVEGIAKSHEQKLQQIYYLSLKVHFLDSEKTQFVQVLKEVTTGNVSPNQLEQQKLIVNCISLMKYEDEFEDGLSVMLENVLNRQLEMEYKKRVISCLPKICSQSQTLLAKVTEQLNKLLDFDNTQVQTCIGKCFASLWQQNQELLPKLRELIDKSLNPKLELNSKRNVVVYIYEVVRGHAAGSSEMRSSFFVEIQQVFMRYLFDRRSFMQDLASKGLSLIYKLGDETQRQLLVTSLSEAFSGTSGPKKKEQDENQELLLDFNDSTASEQRDKLKTYRDLVRVAEELGQRDLIYQFLEVHRHMQHYQDLKNAAKGLSGLLMLDDKIKEALLKIAPKILMLTYDPNQEVCDTMKQLWSALVSVDQEAAFYNSRWSEIFESCVTGIKSEQWRNRQASCLCLSDLVSSANRKWSDISKHYRLIFLTSLALLADDVKESVQQSAYKLVKALRSFTLKFCNMYSNTDLVELEEVLDAIIPLVLEDCLKSHMEKVRQFGIHILAELIRSTQSSNLADKLKINNKYERQIVLSGNSLPVMSQLLCKKQYLLRIITEMILNVSSISDKGNTQLNYAEQLSHEGSLKINATELSEIRMRYSRESILGEILKICRALMTQETFDELLVVLLQIIAKGNYDDFTKQTASGYIQDVILENIQLMSPKNAKATAQKLVQLFEQRTVQACLSMKDTLVSSYASCLGLQFKVLRDFPKTVQTIIQSVKSLNSGLMYIRCLFFFEISKHLPVVFLQEKETSRDFIPIIFVNKFNAQDPKLKKMSEKIWDYYSESMGDAKKLCELLAPEIVTDVQLNLDSVSYKDRIAASIAFKEIVSYCKDEVLVQQTVDKLLQLVYGKYFIGKEDIVESITAMLTDDLIEVKRESYVQSVLPQLQNLKLEANYRNKLLKSLKPTLNQQGTSSLFDVLVVQLAEALQQVVENSQSSLLLESQGQFFDFNERKAEEQAVLTQAINILELMPLLTTTANQPLLDDLAIGFYGKTNWMTRQAILKCYVKLKNCQEFGSFLIRQVADCGEKYELNLAVVSDITYRTLTAFAADQRSPQLKLAARRIVEILEERTSEELRRNIDLIRQLSA